MYQCAVKATKDAYMPNAQRKRQYLSIYADLTTQNETLLKYLVQAQHPKPDYRPLGSHQRPCST